MMARGLIAAFLAFSPAVLARTDLDRDMAIGLLSEIADLKSMDMDDVMCDECLEEIDCIWPCEIMCVLDYPDEYAGEVCSICLDFYGCEGCKFLCPTVDTNSPSSLPTTPPSGAPTGSTDGSTYESDEPSFPPTLAPSSEPTLPPTPEPTLKPTLEPTAKPTDAPIPAPTQEPTSKPTESPTDKPTGQPSYPPTAAPTLAPYAHPSTAPSIPPSHKPTVPPTSEPTSLPTAEPTLAPTSSPDFYVYYSETNDKLFRYDPSHDLSTELFTGDFTGDFKVDSINSFMFWTEPTRGSLIKYDMATDTKSAIIDGLNDWTESLMGLACDPSTGDLYYVSQLDMAVYVIDYSGTNKTQVHDFSDDGLVPYGVDLSPAETMSAESTDYDPGYMMITMCDDTHGYIYTSTLFGGEVEMLYETTTKDIYGIVLDDSNDKMWWIENKGVANGLYNSDFSGGEANFIEYLEGAYWVAAAWDYDLMYVSDYEEGVVYECKIESDDVSSTTTIATVTSPRLIGFWDESEDDATPSEGDILPLDGDLTEPEPMDGSEPPSSPSDGSDTESLSLPESVSPGGGDETTDQVVAAAEAASSAEPSWQAGEGDTTGEIEVETMAEKPTAEDQPGLLPPTNVGDGVSATAPVEEAAPAPPSDVDGGISDMPPAPDGTVADAEGAHIAGSDPRTNDQGTSDVKPEGSRGSAKEKGWQSEKSGVNSKAVELEAEGPAGTSFSVDSTFFTVGGLLVVVGLAAFVVYSRQSRSASYNPVHEAI